MTIILVNSHKISDYDQFEWGTLTISKLRLEFCILYWCIALPIPQRYYLFTKLKILLVNETKEITCIQSFSSFLHIENKSHFCE